MVSSFVSPTWRFLGIYVAARAVAGELAAGDDLDAVQWFPLEGPMPETGFQEDVDVIEMYAGSLAGLPVDSAYAGTEKGP